MSDSLEKKMEEMEVDIEDDDLDESEAADGVGPLGENDELWQKIRDEKKKTPGMFVSAWEEDEDGIEEKNLEDPKEQFLTAAEEGNLEKLKDMIEKYPDFLHTRDRDNYTPLHRAAYNNHIHFLTAAEEGNLEKLKDMIEKYPDFLHTRDRDNYTPLHRAAYNNHIHVCKYLLKIGADPEARTEDGWTVLHCAACWANFDIVAVLLSHGVDVNARSKGNLTPLHLAINSSEEQQKQLMTVKYLLEAPGIDMGAQTNAGDTPLKLAHLPCKSTVKSIVDVYLCYMYIAVIALNNNPAVFMPKTSNLSGIY
uniref:Ankyrin repeat domain-containing protein 49 n=1 Tax=Panagrolaimus sp. JU765 TaxID=591449 RepID=A0AC34R8W1_9BILA